MSKLTDARQALQQTLSLIPDFPVFAYVSDSAPPPCAWIEPDDIDYLQVMGSDVAEYQLVVTVLTGRTSEQAAQETLDDFVGTDGAKSIPAIIESDPTLNDAVQYAVPVSMERYGVFTMAGVEYIGAQVMVEVRI